MEDKKVSISQVIAIGGAFMGFVIGSSFASGQECMQYFTGFGLLKSVGAGIIALILYAWFVSVIVEDGRYLKLNNSGEDVQLLPGKVSRICIGVVYTDYAVLRLFDDDFGSRFHL